jgi:hypothetical protein
VLYLAISVARSLAGRELSERDAGSIIAALQLVAAGVFSYAVYAGQRWARMLVLCGAALQLLEAGSAAFLASSLGKPMPTVVELLRSIAVPVVFVALLMMPETRRWYSKQPEQ